MSLEGKVSVKTLYTRSINLERDQDSLDVLKSYVPTSRAMRTLRRMGDSMSGQGSPRAWTLVGPYGSGKSAFSLFASELLCSERGEFQMVAREKVRQLDSELDRQIARGLGDGNGMMRVLLTGSPSALAPRLLEAILQEAQEIFGRRKGRSPAVLKKMRLMLSEQRLNVADFKEVLSELQTTLARADFSGIFIAIDELGKFLEYEARHHGANDIYLLQALAEHAFAGNDCNLFLVVNLHQSFEQYAKGLSEHLRAEWSKVHGRFEEIPFLESQEQVLRVVASALDQQWTKAEQVLVDDFSLKQSQALAELQALPAALEPEEAAILFASCYPLSPIAALILPVLCQKIAQNERTLFSYLGSQEEFGLRNMLSSFASCEQWIQPHDLYDYFVANQTAAQGDQGLNRRWAEVTTALERLDDVPALAVRVLKTIGLLNIIGGRGGFRASQELLEQLGAGDEVRDALDALVACSSITFRKFAGEYRVWQGSDFDLNEAMLEARDKIGEINLPETLNKGQYLQPIVARRYTIDNGTLRYFVPFFLGRDELKSGLIESSEPRILIALSSTEEESPSMLASLNSVATKLDIVAISSSGADLRETTREVLALELIGRTAPELATDPVAIREYADRLDAAKRAQQGVLDSFFEAPERTRWYHEGTGLAVKNKRDFQVALSDVLRLVFCKAPTVHSELVNRDKPSSNANSARIKLIQAMVHHGDKPGLGFEKFPPEKGVYLSVLHKTGLHKETALNSWSFVAPDKGSPFEHVWSEILDFFASTSSKPRALIELNDVLMAPPYGVKAGMLPILYMAAYCVMRDELVVYEDRRFVPWMTEDLIDRFVKRPDLFTFQQFKMEGFNASLFSAYAETLLPGESVATVLQLVRPIAIRLGRLDEFTQQTRDADRLSTEARNIRDAFKLSKSPHKLLFDEIPNALGVDVDDSDGPALVCRKLIEVMDELSGCHENLVSDLVAELAQCVAIDRIKDVDDLAALRVKAGPLAKQLSHHADSASDVFIFLKKIASTASSPDKQWLKEVMMHLVKRPTEKWTDLDVFDAKRLMWRYRLSIKDLRKLLLRDGQTLASSEGEHFLLQTIKSGEREQSEDVTIGASSREKLDHLKGEYQSLVSDFDRDTRLALLAELLHAELAVSDKVEVEDGLLKDSK